MKVVLVMFHDGERRDFPLTQEKTIVGRRPDAGLRIPTNDVSRQHCEVTQTKIALTVRDLGSSNGTYVNGKRVAESPLKAGDKLGVGPVIFMVQIDGTPSKITPFDLKVEMPTATTLSGPDDPTAMQPPAKPADKKKKDDDDVIDLDDFDIDSMFADDDDDDDDPKPKKAKK
jgi:pSer/pThr/pTyr-binding forkhead associated (FHA) protein